MLEDFICWLFYRYWHWRALKAGFKHVRDDLYERGSFTCNKWGIIALLRERGI